MDATISKKKADKPKYNMWQNSAFMILVAWKKRKTVLWLCLALAGLAVGINLVGLYVTPVILSQIEAAVPLKQLLTTILLFAGALMALNGLNSYFNTNTMFGRIDVRSEVAAMLHKMFMTMSYPHTENDAVSKLRSSATSTVNGNNSACEAIWGTLTDLLKSLLGFAVYLTLFAAIDPILMVVVLATSFAAYFVSGRLAEWNHKKRDEQSGYFRKMYYVNGIAGDRAITKDIRMFGMSDWILSSFNSVLGQFKAFKTKGEKVYFVGDAADAVLAFVRNGIAYLYLIGMVINDGIPASQFLLLFTAVSGFAAWVTGILAAFAKLRQQSLEICYVREFLSYPETFLFEDGEPLPPGNGKSYEIQLHGVSFRYPGAEKDTLTNINLTIKPGEKLAVVGLNGAGKTTLVKLICGYYDPTEGEVLLNGQNIKKYNRRDYYLHFSAVFQDFSLLQVTVAESIAQTDENIDMARVESCIERAGLRGKIESLPAGYETHVGKDVYEDGIELSGGETQRLMLARALYKNAPMIVLDEPTAALDPIAESDLYNKYNELTGGRTSVYISHRLASTRFCDRVLLISDGIIAEEGSHDELMAMKGRYAELFEIQSQYYKKGAVDREQKA